MRLPAGTALGPYEITGAIGAGGMGEVYRARDTRLGREVALKVLPSEVAGDRERLARFEREARSASALNHPNIVTIHDFAHAGSDCYLVMELIRGESLRDVLSRGPLPLKKLLAIAAGIADGLSAAHAAGIIHRDLKPENVMLTAEGNAKILDFGLVKSTSHVTNRDAATEVQMTNSGTIVGTLTYMSPEQAQGQPVGIASDQFSLGVLLHEMATGKHPFLRATAYETVTAIIRDPSPPLGQAFPEPFRWIVERCLSKEPEQRYASTMDLAHDLNALQTRLSAGGLTPAVETSAATPQRRRSWRVAAAVAAVVAMGAIAWAVASLRPAADAARADPLHLHLSTGEFQPDYGEIAVPLAISPDGRRLVLQGTTRAGLRELRMTDLQTGETRVIAQNGSGAVWSSDGSALAFFADGKLKTIRIGGGPPTVVCDAPAESSPSWHGDTILFVRYSGGPDVAGVYRVNASGGVPSRLIGVVVKDGKPRMPWWPHFLPGGKHFVYVDLTMTGQMRIEHELKIASIEGKVETSLGAIDSRAAYSDGKLLYVRDGTLLAHPFDPQTLRFTGDAVPVINDLHYFRSTGMAAFAVSDTGILVWRSAQRASRLVWLDRNGFETAEVDTGTFDGTGRLARDGKRYAAGVIDPAQGISDIWMYDLERGSSDRVTFELLDEKAPVWAGDGSTLYYRTDGNGGPPDIFELRAGARPKALYAGRGVEHPEDVSPDGKSLLFTSYLAGPADIQLLPLDPVGAPRPFVVTPMSETSPRFSPDGRWVAYTSNLSGRSEVYVKPFDATGVPQRISQSGGHSPRWSESELFFVGQDGRFFAVPARGSIGTPRMLFQSSDAVTFEVPVEGDRFLVQMKERGGDPDVQIVVNWPSAPGSL